MNYELKKEGKFQYIESGGSSENLLLLHGLFGALSNFQGIIDHFGPKYNVVVPIIPIFELPLLQVSLSGLCEHIVEFVKYKGYEKAHILGNSLGGHVALLYAMADPDHVKTITLTGSSGLFENAMGSSFPKRGDYDFIKKKTEDTFYDPKVATKELVDEVFDITNDRGKAIRIIATAKSAIRNNLENRLHEIKVPTLLIWGKEDNVTPAFVGEKFNELISRSELYFIDRCGHAPMMEHPDEFNRILYTFLEKNS
ncbi:MAG TPA: alpha/beta hydrolase [Saprospiraceae bacterium]|nr:alpha/beta hydrolase [Saprospiraceae bacterium]